MAKKRLKKKVKYSLLLFVLFLILIIGGIKGFQTYRYHQSYEYKLLQKTYTLDETKVLIDKLNNKELEEILSINYNKKIVPFVKEKYFIYTNINRYLDYQKKNKDSKEETIISLVNVNRDKDYYADLINTEVSLNEAMLVNKYHALTKDYEALNIIKTSSSYSYANNELNETAYNAFKELADAAKIEGHLIIINSSYRSYERQDELWNARKNSFGIRKADQYAARAGSSEHETGYAIDVADFNDQNDEFGKTESFTWMINNCYKYGYILRYPENKENITGYSYEPWHYRYLGKDLATKVYKSGLTFDEYYEFYLNNK